ncbi:uncharacterized protein EI97DRAFT_418390 [Westerdykella ornata]|uniref:Nuclear pore complex component n=1 Tax=Westerdykella ornata TaxID=318751 RepID=A0A6A6JJQ1_WESOR|nr:uncharacterized protein EI97DRAFT_418390 [Westerdykella ornata]KAF2276465.1 hypothetical protein EI97DRAFT_418390 [Westerdykella ornata]
MNIARSPATPVTPAAQKVQQETPTGSWRHPKLDEIVRRQNATAFSESNVNRIVANAAVLFFTYVAFNARLPFAILRMLQTSMINFTNSIPYSSYMLGAIRLVFVLNIVHALWPLVLRYYPDDVADIPLTPSQRQAMGLDPNVSTPQTPGSEYASPNYITPPRYQRSTPRSLGTSGERYSPLSGSPRGSFGLSTSHSPFSPNNGSPLFQKVLGGSPSKRIGFDRSSPLSGSLFMESSSSSTPSTPTPGAGKASVGLNNKWLYEKGRDGRGSSLYS